MDITRRQLLGLLGAGGLSLTLGKLPVFGKQAPLPDLAVITGPDPRANVRAAIAALGGMQRFVSRHDRVVIKPNMGFANPPQQATTTDPRVVRTIAELALQAGARRVLIFDHSGPGQTEGAVLRQTGIRQACSSLDDVHVFLISSEKFFVDVGIPLGKQLKQQQVSRDVMDADVLINVPMAKSHGGAKISLGLKNWMGVVYNRSYWHTRVDLHQAIADFATIMSPALTVLDATRALVTGGPMGPGKITQLDTIVAGKDPIAVDSYGVTLAPWENQGYKAKDIPHLVKARDHGLGVMDIDKISVVQRNQEK